jgi:purine-binding chemotaxis protein CheW
MIKTMVRNIEGRYLTFTLAQREYGVEIQKVREILEPLALEPLPQAASHVRWVIRLRNRVVPVVDLRRCLGLGNTGARPNRCVLTVVIRGWNGPFLMGILVDGVREVLQVWSKDLEESTEEDRPEAFLRGPVRSEERLVSLVDVDGLAEEVEAGQFNSIDGGSHEVF